MNIGKIKDILSGYGSEKGFDFVISKVRELSKNKQLKENINELIKLELSAFEKADRDGEYDFPGLIDFLKEFGSESFIESYVYAYIESDSLENKKELIRKECIRDTKANTQESEQSVRRIVDRCFSIVDEHLLSCLSKEELIQARVIIKSIEEALKQQTESIEVILQTYLNKFTTLFSLHASSTTYHACPSPANDNQTYRDAFTNPLFLEDDEEDENVVSLADMYISPSIGENKASECIKKWYNTKTKPCLLLYGNAGVGKSSLVAKILADANGETEKSKVEFYFDSSKVMAVALRNHTDKIENELTAKKILTKLFNCDFAEQLQDKLLILDGLDELCVLKHDFNGKIFLQKLSSLENGYHVLVTSRESKSYFSEPNNKKGLKTERLIWKENQIKDWLDLYKAKKPNKNDWCNKLYNQFALFKKNDKRRDIFCVPIILYICGTSETNIEDHSSIGSTYRDAFTKILMREHLTGQSNTYDFIEADKKSNMTAWQFTKELAYQMFLLDTLDLVDDIDPNNRRAVGFRNAQKRTYDILEEEYGIKGPNLELKKELAVCPFATENEKGGIAFAHKTVYEYFTAVKLYEDYFAEFDEKYFNTKADDTAAMDVMESFIEAFRYDGIKDDIFLYLCKMNEEPFSTTLGYSESQGLDYKKYEASFVYGMQKRMYTRLALNRAIDEYLYYNEELLKYKSINQQISTAFANFTYFLTRHGFKNEEKIPECKLIGNFLHGSSRRANFIGWHLEDAYLQGAYLKGACLQGANLAGADLRGADLTDAHLIGANLTGANLIGADLTDADLRGAYLSSADLRGADLRYADLRYADLRGAKYCNTPSRKTIFPEGFDPKEHGMIEVDYDGNPV